MRKTLRLCSVASLLFGIIIAVPAKTAVVGVDAAPQLERTKQYKQDELLVKFRPGTSAQQARTITLAADAVEARSFQRPRRLSRSEIDAWRLLRLRPGANLMKARSALLKNPNVALVEYNYEVRIALTPNDPRFGELWGLHNIGQTSGTVDADVDAPEAWDLQTGGNDVVVAVIDTGVDYNHPDLQANIWTNTAEIPGNGIDDDANGYIDDVHGYDFSNNDSNPFDDHGHGTHVAGTIAAVGDNGVGVVGVSWRARIMAVKFLGAGGSGSTSGAISAVLYAADMGAKVMNNSWGGGGFSQALLDAIATADAAGALFVAAAGNSNSNNDANPHYPSSYEAPNVLAVAATDHNDAKASFSSYGAASVDLGAPGVNILSTVPGAGDSCCSDPSGYKVLNGTSMATPHVSGTAAVVFAQFPGVTHQQVKQRLMGAVNAIPSLAGATVTGGRLNLFNALESDTTPPAAVTGLAVNGAGGRSAQLTWIATGDDGTSGKAATYDLRYAIAPIDASNFAAATQAVGEPTPATPGTAEIFTVKGLNPATTYYFALKAFDNVGNISVLSNVVQLTTQSVSVVFRDDMESGAGNWTVAGSDGAGGPALWHLSTHRYNTPNNAFYYGREDTLAFDTGARNFGSITSMPIDLTYSRDTWLRFVHYLQTENFAPYDAARTQVSMDDGISWQDLHVTSLGTAGQMLAKDIDLSAYDGRIVRLRFSFDTVDAVANNYEGWVVDDVLITGITNGQPYPNQPPVAKAGGPYSGFKRAAINHNGSASYDPDGDMLTYLWDFGDGATGTGPTPTHAYATSGTHTVTLVVNDGKANSPPATTTVTVINRVPVAKISTNAWSTDKFKPVQFSGEFSTDADGDALTYRWNFGDGTTASGAQVSHAWTKPGTYTVTLVANDGEVDSAPASVTIIVAAYAPYANAGPDQTVVQRSTVTLNGTGSFDTDGNIVAYAWKQFSGEPIALVGANTATPSFVAPNVRGSGALQAIFALVVTDDDGLQSFDDLVEIVIVKK